MSTTKIKGSKPKWDAQADTVRALRKAHSNIKQKCSNPNDPQYKNYGKRGISFQSDWAADRELFVAAVIKDIGLKTCPSDSLDRTDNDGNYAAGNLRWASKKEQASNRRSSHTIEVKGMKLAVAEIAHDLGVAPDTFAKRLKRGERWSPEAADFQKIWLEDLQSTDRLPIAFSPQQKKAVTDMCERLPLGFRTRPLIGYAIRYWPEFSEFAAEAAGLRYYPSEPDVTFFVQQIAAAAMFAKRKHAEIERRMAPIRQAQKEREADEAEARAYEEQSDAYCSDLYDRREAERKAREAAAAARAAGSEPTAKADTPVATQDAGASSAAAVPKSKTMAALAAIFGETAANRDADSKPKLSWLRR